MVTRERPIVQRSKSLHQSLVYSQNKQPYKYSTGSYRREIYDDVTSASNDDDVNVDDDDDVDDCDRLSRPVGIIRINDRHLRESMFHTNDSIIK